MEFEVKESKQLSEGRHVGVVTKVEYRTEPFEYTDLFIESENILVKAGYPSVVSEKSKLGKLLKRFGAELKVGAKIDPDTLIGLKCQFLTTSEETKDGTFARVLADTVKPLNGNGD